MEPQLSATTLIVFEIYKYFYLFRFTRILHSTLHFICFDRNVNFLPNLLPQLRLWEDKPFYFLVSSHIHPHTTLTPQFKEYIQGFGAKTFLLSVSCIFLMMGVGFLANGAPAFFFPQHIEPSESLKQHT